MNKTERAIQNTEIIYKYLNVCCELVYLLNFLLRLGDFFFALISIIVEKYYTQYFLLYHCWSTALDFCDTLLISIVNICILYFRTYYCSKKKIRKIFTFLKKNKLHTLQAIIRAAFTLE